MKALDLITTQGRFIITFILYNLIHNNVCTWLYMLVVHPAMVKQGQNRIISCSTIYKDSSEYQCVCCNIMCLKAYEKS